MALFYLSFADNSGFLGAIITEADSVPDAVNRTTEMKTNPGGEVLAYDVTLYSCPYPKDRLLSLEEMAVIDGGPGKKLSQMTEDERESCQAHEAGMVHEQCNPTKIRGR